MFYTQHTDIEILQRSNIKDKYFKAYNQDEQELRVITRGHEQQIFVLA